MKTEMIDCGIEREKCSYPCEVGGSSKKGKKKEMVTDYPEFTVRDKPELFDTPDDEFEAVVKLKRSSREERPDYDDPEKKRLYVGFKVIGMKPVKKAESKMATADDFKVDFSDIEGEDGE